MAVPVKQALAIGNSAYQIDPLKTCLNDSTDVGKQFALTWISSPYAE